MLHTANQLVVRIAFWQFHIQQLKTGADIVDRIADFMRKDGRNLTENSPLFELLSSHPDLLVLTYIRKDYSNPQQSFIGFDWNGLKVDWEVLA
jgi:hypothetical protein